MADKFVVGKYYVNANVLCSIYLCKFVDASGDALLAYVKRHPKVDPASVWGHTSNIATITPANWDEYEPPKEPLKGRIVVLKQRLNNGTGSIFYRNAESSLFAYPEADYERLAYVDWTAEKSTLDEDFE